MATLFEGNGLNGKAVDIEAGPNPSSGKYEVKWNMEVVDGPHAGKKASYKGKLDPDNIKWTKRDMIAIGWQGKDIRTFVDDATKAAKTVAFTAKIVTWTSPKGKEMTWTAAESIGYQAQPLGQFDNESASKVNNWFAEAGEIGPQGGSTRTDDSDLPF